MSLLPSPASTPPHISEIATQHDIGLEATEWRWFQNQGLSDTSIDQMLRNVNRVTLRIEDDGDCLNRMRRCAERFNIPLGPDTITQAEEEYRKQFSMDAMWKEFTGRTEEEADIPEFLFEDWMGMQYLDAFNSFRRFVMKMEPCIKSYGNRADNVISQQPPQRSSIRRQKSRSKQCKRLTNGVKKSIATPRAGTRQSARLRETATSIDS